jgi:hypothetical protein
MRIIVLGLVCLLSFSVAKVDMNTPVSLEESLKISAEVMNKSLPVMIDAELRHDKVMAEGKKLIFKYTLVHFTKEEMSAHKLKSLMEEDTKKEVCSDKDSQMILKKGLTMVYDYSDKNKQYIAKFVFDAKACGIETDIDTLKNLLNLVKKKEAK